MACIDPPATHNVRLVAPLPTGHVSDKVVERLRMRYLPNASLLVKLLEDILDTLYDVVSTFELRGNDNGEIPVIGQFPQHRDAAHTKKKIINLG